MKISLGILYLTLWLSLILQMKTDKTRNVFSNMGDSLCKISQMLYCGSKLLLCIFKNLVYIQKKL